MHTLTIVAICLLASSVLQYVGFYLYSTYYKKRFLSSYSSVDLRSDASFHANPKTGDKAVPSLGSARQQKHIRKSIANLPSRKSEKVTKMHVVKSTRKQLAAVAKQG